ncbi:hypothetical protein BDEG_24152 [Batrachochytrium dendrobatidis JEL423]|uniref:Aminoglycoside phosphotransferase domain-containing protein n=1 Tax=Batrachochytrium dendrobatidis (strain JEL423) TaxID=403673 RepID=A0A177WK09_BATDL|nr:hypothetical protein BDEG_24152 [Batrachochytrium dendrobatidis JEL423]
MKHRKYDKSKSTIMTPFDLAKLGLYLAKHLPPSFGLVFPLTARQFKFGQSNPTFLVADAHGHLLVIRKKPPGTLMSQTAHAVEREYWVLDSLYKHRSSDQTTWVPVPQVYLLCQDHSVLGTPFYAMEYLNGRIFENILIPFYSAIDTLVRLHCIDYRKAGLEEYGKSGGYYQRQLKRLHQVSQIQANIQDKNGSNVGKLVHLDDSLAWLHKNIVADQITIVHGDYKLDNLVFHLEKPQIIGILDWELSTIGHPLSDLANFLMPWYFSKRQSGMASGLYDALAVIAQGIAARVKRGQASSHIANSVAAIFQDMADRLHGITTNSVSLDESHFPCAAKL